MHVVSLAPIPVSSVTWRKGSSPWATTVVAKLTFRLEPGKAQLAKRHDPIYERDELPDEGGSLYAPSDLVPVRDRVDVTLVGSAYAPGGIPVTSLRVRLAVGAIDKALRIDTVGAGDRTGSFKSALLGYEYADASPDNPAGRRAPDHHRIALANGKAGLAGFGPLAANWPRRLRRLGGASPVVFDDVPCEIDDRIDLGFFNAAPPDQQLAELLPNTPIELENLHPDHPRLRTRLPDVAPQIYVERPRGGRVAIEAPIRGLWIDTRRAVVTTTHLATIPLESPDEPGRIWVAVAGPGRRLSPVELDKLIGSLQGADELVEATEDGPDDEPTTDETNHDVLRRSRRARPSTRERTDTSLLSKEHVMERTVAPAELFGPDPNMPAWLSSPASDGTAGPKGPPRPGTPFRRAGSPSHPPPPRRRPSGFPPARGPAITQAGIGPTPWSEDLASTSSLPKLEAPTPSLVRPPVPSLPAAVEPAPPPPRPEPETPSRAERAEVVEMLWYDEEATPLLRQRFRGLCEELDFAPRDDRHDLPESDPKRARDHHTHFGVLTQAERSDHAMLRRALREAVSETGRFTPPLVALRGTLALTFDDLEVLRVTAAVVKPIAADDKKLKATLDQVAELEASPLLSGASDTVKRFTEQLRKLYREGRRSLSADYLEETVARVLLERRQFARRKLFGGEVLRAVFNLQGDTRAYPCYLSDALADRLPMLPGFPARLLAEVHVKQDQYESSPHALRVVTLGRVIRLDE